MPTLYEKGIRDEKLADAHDAQAFFGSMQILRWQVDNPLKNYQYIIVDTHRKAILIDPLDVMAIQKIIESEALFPAAILITHEHHDHAGKVKQIQGNWSIPAYASEESAALFEGDTTIVHDKENIPISLDFKIIPHFTPGHTAGHTAYEIGGFLFSGDALMHGGCGHCRSANSNIEEHYATINERLNTLSPDLIVMPGHYYAARNLDFTLHIEPENKRAHEMRARLQTESDELEHQTTLKQEKEYNVFMRLGQRNVRAHTAALIEKNLSEVNDLTVFKELRTLRDQW
ncbi:MAG TPA: MBL fold metallo-hydrolase [Turneriella sp.]|nr:MBL fold metallo-hydrolase [Turneriella sp.]